MKKPKYIIKRDGSHQKFTISKIENAIWKAMFNSKVGTKADAKKLSTLVLKKIDSNLNKDVNYTPHVEEVQDIVEEVLMEQDFFTVAKAYIIYREKRAEARTPDIFKKRLLLKPAEYPYLLEYVDSIRHSYWIHTEFNYTGDVQDYHANLNEIERNAIKNAMLAISQVEVAVKNFWSDIYHKLPKPEIASVGATFAESEVRHHDAYSHLLELLGLNEEFKNLYQYPAIINRVNYLEDALLFSRAEDNRKYSFSLALFSLFIEHVSLFSQFLIIMSFNKYRSQLKGISNAVEATSKEEQIHGNFGIEIINLIKSENPEWFDEDFYSRLTQACQTAYDSESQVIDWIYEKGDLSFLPASRVKEFVKDRFNRSLEAIGAPTLFTVDELEVEKTSWFDDEILATKHGDFFVKRSINYSKRAKSITSKDLF